MCRQCASEIVIVDRLLILDGGQFTNYGIISACAIKPRGPLVIHNEGKIEHTVACNDPLCEVVNCKGAIIVNFRHVSSEEFPKYAQKPIFGQEQHNDT